MFAELFETNVYIFSKPVLSKKVFLNLEHPVEY